MGDKDKTKRRIAAALEAGVRDAAGANANLEAGYYEGRQEQLEADIKALEAHAAELAAGEG